jgi:hypothetical protein
LSERREVEKRETICGLATTFFIALGGLCCSAEDVEGADNEVHITIREDPGAAIDKRSLGLILRSALRFRAF